MTYLLTNELDAFTVLLLHESDSSEFWQIKINGNITSFHGVRLFANEGVAKTALNRALQYMINQIGYRSSYPPTDASKESIINAYDTIKSFIEKNATKENFSGKRYFSDAEVRILAPKLRDELIKSGHIKIEKI